MTDDQEPSLAATLAALLRDHDKSVSHVMRYSGLTRNTIVYILSGKTRHPTMHTLSAIAAAIATDAYTRERDRQKMTEIERLLAVGAGYADPTAQEARTMLELSLYYVLASRERARAWAEVIALLATLPPDAVRRLPSLVDTEGVTR